jgi:phosphoribosyl 1,2-cyclic phosphodiesterase
MSGLSLVVAGCRGSMAVSGPQYQRFGGNTTCYHAEVEPGHHLLIDAGTGLRELQHAIAGRTEPQRFTIFLSHYHWDHIQGLALFAPLYDPASRFDIWAPALEGRDPERALWDVICRPWWPVALAEAPAKVRIRPVQDDVEVGTVLVRSAELHHPGGVIGYRLEGSHTVVVATDQETGVEEFDERLVKLAHRADVLVHDAQYTPGEHHGPRLGWGHSDWEGASRIAHEAGVTRLVLTSHDPDRTDDEVEAIQSAARALFPLTDAAHEGMRLPL